MKYGIRSGIYYVKYFIVLKIMHNSLSFSFSVSFSVSFSATGTGNFTITIIVPVVFMAWYLMILRGATSLIGAHPFQCPE